jgi:hypothetical protein
MRPSVSPRLFVCPHERTREPLNEFPLNLTLCSFTKICRHIKIWLKFDNDNGHFTWIRTCTSACRVTGWGIPTRDFPHVNCATLRGILRDDITQRDRQKSPHPRNGHWSQVTLTWVAPFAEVKVRVHRLQNCYTLRTSKTRDVGLQ